MLILPRFPSPLLWWGLPSIHRIDNMVGGVQGCSLSSYLAIVCESGREVKWFPPPLI
jgi:hypothetical protein